MKQHGATEFKYSTLVLELLNDEGHTALLKNHEARLTESLVVLEAHATTHVSRGSAEDNVKRKNKGEGVRKLSQEIIGNLKTHK